MTPELTNIYMQWQYWITTANYYAAVSNKSDNERWSGLFEDAIGRANYIQREFEKKKEELVGASL